MAFIGFHSNIRWANKREKTECTFPVPDARNSALFTLTDGHEQRQGRSPQQYKAQQQYKHCLDVADEGHEQGLRGTGGESVEGVGEVE